MAESLIRHIQDHPDLIEEETVEALGEMGNPAAGPELSKLLRSPRSSLRRASAKALGRLGSHDAVEALRTVAAEIPQKTLILEYKTELRKVPGAVKVPSGPEVLPPRAVLAPKPPCDVHAAPAGPSELPIKEGR